MTSADPCVVGIGFCPIAGDSTRPAAGFNIGFNWTQCLAGTNDADLDSVDDTCENRLAGAFAPMLQVTRNECDWDYQLDRLGGEYYFIVQRIDQAGGSRIRIGYLPAYYKDCGGGDPHPGDSEAIFIDAVYASDGAGHMSWQFLQAFLSAHCGYEAGDLIHTDYDCHWYDHGYWDSVTIVQYVNNVRRGAPIVYVSTGKHANYHNRAACVTSLAAQLNYEVCHSDDFRRFPVLYAWQNVGSYGHASAPNSLLFPQWGSALAVPGTAENIWTSAVDFRGWQGTPSGSTSYATILSTYGHFFDEVIVTGPDPCITEETTVICGLQPTPRAP